LFIWKNGIDPAKVMPVKLNVAKLQLFSNIAFTVMVDLRVNVARLLLLLKRSCEVLFVVTFETSILERLQLLARTNV
jgi:hypothetical protein